MICIETLEGVRYDLASIGLIPLNFTPSSPSPKHFTEEIEGRNGYLDLGTTFGGRTIRVKFLLEGKDIYDYFLLIAEVFKLFDARTTFFLINKYEPGKRWRVKTSTMYTPDRLNPLSAAVDIEFKSSSTFCESYGTTLNPFTFDSELWQVGQGVISEDLVYVHNTSSFRIWNGSDIEIDPRELPLLIKYQGVSDRLTIKNLSTGDDWSYSGTSSINDTITLDGVKSLKNGQSILKSTNKKLITLKPGWNDFELTGASDFLITFDFRFYYF
ncbi:phage tail family protein [Bacillus sp. JJ722]|uniref:phage tail family protein n=1 Tax=Bacillus sp. JJ722 TaxID=3122973 RepID=UPI002FFF3F58